MPISRLVGAKLFNPRHEVGSVHITFGTVTDRATWYAIIKRVTLMAVDAVDAVVPAMNRWRVFGLSSAVVARLTRKSMDLVLGQHKTEAALLGAREIAAGNSMDAMVPAIPFTGSIASCGPRFTGIDTGVAAWGALCACATGKTVGGPLERIATVALGSPNDVTLAIAPARVACNGDFAEALIGQILTLKAPDVTTPARGKGTTPRTLPDGTTIALDDPYWRTCNIAPARPAQDGDFTLA